MTPTEATLWPMFAHVALIYVLYFLLSKQRFAAVRAGRAKASQFRDNRSEPDESVAVRNCLSNQFELPVLFYAASILLYLVDADNLVTVAFGLHRRLRHCGPALAVACRLVRIDLIAPITRF